MSIWTPALIYALLVLLVLGAIAWNIARQSGWFLRLEREPKPKKAPVQAPPAPAPARAEQAVISLGSSVNISRLDREQGKVSHA